MDGPPQNSISLAPDADAPPAPLPAFVARCSFCDLGEGEVARLFQGRAGYICDECIDVCLALLADYRELGLPPPDMQRPWYQRWFGEQTAVACAFAPHDAENPQGERLFSGGRVQICEQCVAACAALKTDA